MKAGFLRECLESSLQRLGVDHVDLYYIHRRDQSIPIEDVTGTLAEFVKEGKIGGIGYSEISPASLERAATVHPIAAVQSEYSLWSRLPELGMLQACERLGTAFVAFSPVARGVLSDVTLDPAKFPDDDFRKPMPRFQPVHFERNMKRVEAFRAFASVARLEHLGPGDRLGAASGAAHHSHSRHPHSGAHGNGRSSRRYSSVDG